MIKRSHASEEPSVRAPRRFPTRSFTSAVEEFLRSAGDVARVGCHGNSQRQSSIPALKQRTTAFADSGALTASMIQNAVGSDPATLTPGFASLPRSKADRFKAVGTGVDQAAFILVSTGQAISGGLEPRRRKPRRI